MRRLSNLTTITLILVAFSSRGLSQENRLSSDEVDQGWQLLFDGETTKGWRNYNREQISPNWKVVDGTLRANKGGSIITENQYEHFEWVIEWNTPKGGNSGLMFWVKETKGPPYVTGPEIQIIGDMTPGKNKSAGACYDVYAPTKDTLKPAGQWNQYRIVVNPNNDVQHWVNGELVCEYTIGSDEWNERVANSKWKKAAEYGKTGKGHLCIQDHGAEIWIRNVKVRPLK